MDGSSGHNEDQRFISYGDGESPGHQQILSSFLSSLSPGHQQLLLSPSQNWLQQLLSSLPLDQQQLLSSPWLQQLLSSASPDWLQILSLSNRLQLLSLSDANQTPVPDPNVAIETQTSDRDPSLKTAVVPDTTSNPSSGHTKKNLASDGKLAASSSKSSKATGRKRRRYDNEAETEEDNNNINNAKTGRTTGNKFKVKATQSSINVMAGLKKSEDPHVMFEINLPAKVEDIKKEARDLIQEQIKLYGKYDERLTQDRFTMSFEHGGKMISLLTEGNLKTAIENAKSKQLDYLLFEVQMPPA